MSTISGSFCLREKIGQIKPAFFSHTFGLKIFFWKCLICEECVKMYERNIVMCRVEVPCAWAYLKKYETICSIIVRNVYFIMMKEQKIDYIFAFDILFKYWNSVGYWNHCVRKTVNLISMLIFVSAAGMVKQGAQAPAPLTIFRSNSKFNEIY